MSEEVDVYTPVVEPTDREILLEIHGFMSEIKTMAADTLPMLDKLGKSSMGKMLGLR